MVGGWGGEGRKINTKLFQKKKEKGLITWALYQRTKNLELRGKIKGNWIGTGEGFTIKFFNKRKGALTKQDFRTPAPCHTAAGEQSGATVLVWDPLLHAVLLYEVSFSPFWSLAQPRTGAMGGDRVPWSGKLNVHWSWMGKATWLTCYTQSPSSPFLWGRQRQGQRQLPLVVYSVHSKLHPYLTMNFS